MAISTNPSDLTKPSGLGMNASELDIDTPAVPGGGMATTGLGGNAAAPTTTTARTAASPTATTMATQGATGGVPAPSSDINRHLADFMGSNSPVMQQARTSGLQQANSRGLLNSTMGIQAAEDAAYKVALPAASQMAGQGFQMGVLDKQQDFAREQQLTDQQFRQQVLELEQEFNRQTQAIDLDFKDRLADKNIAAYDREKAASLAAAYQNSYAQMFSAIAQNANLPSKVRESYLSQIGRMRDSNMALVEQFYEVDLAWDTPAYGGGTTSGSSDASSGGSSSGGSSSSSSGKQVGDTRKVSGTKFNTRGEPYSATITETWNGQKWVRK